MQTANLSSPDQAFMVWPPETEVTYFLVNVVLMLSSGPASFSCLVLNSNAKTRTSVHAKKIGTQLVFYPLIFCTISLGLSLPSLSLTPYLSLSLKLSRGALRSTLPLKLVRAYSECPIQCRRRSPSFVSSSIAEQRPPRAPATSQGPLPQRPLQASL